MRILVLLLIIMPSFIFAEAGVIVPRGMSYPNESYLSTQKMRVDVEIDSLFVNVKIMQIFKNNKNYEQEGEYIFTLPDQAMISNFAIWEDGKRIKGIIMEKKKARKLYEKITARKVDPGLFEQDNNASINKFKVNVYPIPANGYKRIEIQYTELLPVNFFRTSYHLPLKPILFNKYKYSIENFIFHFSYKNDVPYEELTWVSPFNIDLKNPSAKMTKVVHDKNKISFSFQDRNFILSDDFVCSLKYDFKDTLLNMSTYRDLDTERIDYSPDNNGKRYKDKTGFFKGDFYLNSFQKAKADSLPKKVVLVFDRSLSMKWLKLTKSIEILSHLLNTLTEKDQVKLVAFSNEVKEISSFKQANKENLKTAYENLVQLPIKNGTNIKQLIQYLKKQEKGTYVYLITDGQATLEEIRDKELMKQFKMMDALRLFVFAVGSDTDKQLLTSMAMATNGYYLHFFENENIKIKMKLFDGAVSMKPIADFKYTFKDAKNLQDVYSVQQGVVYDESVYSLVGKYIKPMKTSLTLFSNKQEKNFQVDLPEKDTKHVYIKKIWAKARINYLLYMINNEGEKKAWIDEIIALSKEYMIVTPYTSFLAAPRSLIRPRSIIPGDPVLRVKTDKDIVSVVAKFEFGLTKVLNYIPERNIWEIRFLAPDYLKDGDYKVELFLTEKDGNSLIETKYITIDSTPPILKKKYQLDQGRVKFIVNASKDTKKIYAYVDDEVISIRYSKKEGHSVGYLDHAHQYKGKKVKYVLEDFAHNSSTVYDIIDFGE